MSEILDLTERCLRKRIDGINFTLILPFEELENLSGEALQHQVEMILNNAVSKIGNVFRFSSEFANKLKSKISIDLNDSLGIYVEVFLKGIDLFIIIQFKGYFFTRDDAFLCCQTSLITLIDIFGAFFRITTIDLAQDFLAKVNQVLPSPSVVTTDYKYCFKFKYRQYTQCSKDGKVDTGFEFYSSRYKITVYDKILENKGAKNPVKKKYYLQLYGQYEKVGVTRVEIRIKQELCKDISQVFFDLNVTEEQFINFVLSKFYCKHKLKVQPEKSRDKDHRRWIVHRNWELIFNPPKDNIPNIITAPDYIFTSPDTNIEKHLRQLVESFIHIDPERSKEQILEAISKLDFEGALRKVEHRKRTREETQYYLDSMKRRVLRENQDLFNIESGQLGIPITSPTKSIDH